VSWRWIYILYIMYKIYIHHHDTFVKHIFLNKYYLCYVKHYISNTNN
jgi:hypothetical protein